MKWVYGALGCLLGAAVAVGLVLLLHHSDDPPSFNANAEGSSAVTLTIEAVEQRFDYRPIVACPEDVDAVAGVTFTCEALIHGHRLVPVELEVFSRLGRFVRVIDVWESEIEQAEYLWCKAHGKLQGRGPCAAAFEQATGA